jgi:hypothetical protein
VSAKTKTGSTATTPIFLIITLLGLIVSIRNLEILQFLDTAIVFEGYYFTQLLTVLLIFVIGGYLLGGALTGSLTRAEAVEIVSDVKSALAADKKTQSQKSARSSDSFAVAAVTEGELFDLGEPITIPGFRSFNYRGLSARIAWNRITTVAGVVAVVILLIWGGGAVIW